MKTKTLSYIMATSLILLFGTFEISYSRVGDKQLQEKFDLINEGIMNSQTSHFDYDSNYVVYVSRDFYSLLDGLVSVYLFKKKPEGDHFITGDVLVMAMSDSLNYKFRLMNSGMIIGIRDHSGEKLFVVSEEDVETFLTFMDFGINPYIRLGVPLIGHVLTGTQRASLLLGELLSKVEKPLNPEKIMTK